MISEHDKIFKNLPAQQELSLEQARQQGDWVGLADMLHRFKEELREVIRLAKVREKDETAFLISEKWNLFIKEKPPILVIDGSQGVPGDVGFLHLIYYETYKIIEGALLTAFMMGSEVGYFYISSDQSRAVAIVQKALEACYAQGILGNNILGTNFSFHLYVHYGSTDYVSYSNEALIDFLAGEKQTTGTLFGKPVLIHKIETIASLPTILKRGGEWFSSLGTSQSAGTKVFSFSGHVNKPCVIEENFGVSLRSSLEQYAGGIRGGWSHLNFIFPGGLESPLLPHSFCNDLILSYEGVGAFHSSLGNGAIVVVNGSVKWIRATLTAMEFFEKVPMGACIFCVKGIPSILSLLREEKNKEKGKSEKDLMATQLKSLSQKIEERCSCGYARRALNPIKGYLLHSEDVIIEGKEYTHLESDIHAN